MGYDINVFFEIKNNNGEWKPYGRYYPIIDKQTNDVIYVLKNWYENIVRNYELFGVLSGIKVPEENKEKYPIIFKIPRGYPEDISKEIYETISSIINECYDSYEGYEKTGYLSYITYEEIENYKKEFEKKQKYYSKFGINPVEILDNFQKEISDLSFIKYCFGEYNWDNVPNSQKRVIFYYDW